MEPGLDPFFAGHDLSRQLFEAVDAAVQGAVGPVDLRISKTQLSYRRRIAFAWVWVPEQHLRRAGAPLVLSLGLRRRDPSPRWKEVVEPYPGRFMHHLEVYSPDALDEEVLGWVREAWLAAG